MKRIRGLTFKIFIIIFVGFMIVFVYGYRKDLDYYIHTELSPNSMDYSYLYFHDLSNKILQKQAGYIESDMSVLKEDINNFPYNSSGYIALLDGDGNLIEEKDSLIVNDSLHVAAVDMNSFFQNQYQEGYIDLSSFDEKEVKKMKSLLQNDPEKIIYFDGEIKPKNEFTNISIEGIEIDSSEKCLIKPSFLKIDDTIFLDGEAKNIMRGQKIDLTYNYQQFSEYDFNEEGMTDYSYRKEIVHHMIENHFNITYTFPVQSVSSDGDEWKTTRIDYDDLPSMIENHSEMGNVNGYDIYQGNGCTVYIQQLYDDYSKRPWGYLVCVTNISKDIVSIGLRECLEDNMPMYIMSIIFIGMFSYLISYLITRRIKKIDRVACLITQHDFDTKLDEKGYDELTSLSKHINAMSTSLKENINQLQNEIDNVKRLENLRKEFVANFTHEIKTPLAIINGNVDLLEETADVDKRKQYIDMINKEIKVINDLILQMLDLSKLEAKTIILEKENINLKELSEDIIDEYEHLLKEKNLLVDLKGENAQIYADKKRIGMVIQNYLSNAIKHACDKSTIHISINKQRFSIENKGKHISDEMKEKIWQSFISDDNKGTGLGLAICKNILELHGFGYDVYNSDEGVVFYFDWNIIGE